MISDIRDSVPAGDVDERPSRMVTFENWLAFSLASLLLLATPGPTVLTVIGHAIAHGRGAGRALVAAVFLGDSTSAALSVAGLGLLLQGSVFWLEVLQAAGGLYLAYLGFGFLRAPHPDSVAFNPAGSNARRKIFGSTYLVSALNPKGIVFFTAFLPLFLEPADTVFPQLCILAATFVVLATLTAALYAGLASASRVMIGKPETLAHARRCAGALLLFMGILALVGLRA